MTAAETEWLLNNRPFLGAVAFLFGTIVGSFINVVAYRLPKMMELQWKSHCHDFLGITPESNPAPSMNLAFPASHCPHCGHTIRWWENIPVISYLFLRGKCSACQHGISIQYPLAEVVNGLLSAIVILCFGFSPMALAALLLTWMLLTLTIIDLRTQLLPDDITLPLLWLGLLVNLCHLFTSLENAVLGAIAGYLVLWLVYWIFRFATGKEGMGYGDFKLLAALGAWLGWQALPSIILVSSLVGSICGAAWLLLNRKDRQTPIPFGPFLASAGWVVLLWGERLNGLFAAILS